jgi:cytoskeletal protein CcmA (bactofilin family)
MKGFLGSSGTPGSPTSSGPTKPAAVETLIGRQTEVLGDVRFTGGLHVDGKIKGSVSVAGGDKAAALSISESGVIEGDVRVPNIMLNGLVVGDVRSTERLSLASKARINGNVHYKVLQMESGAVINGQVLYEGAEQAALTHQKQAEAKPAAVESKVTGLQEGLRATKTA